MSPEDRLGLIVAALQDLREEHLRIASRAQASRSRAASIEVTLRGIQALSARQDELLKESAMAAHYGLYRSAHVAAFAALVDAVHQRAHRLGLLSAIQAKRAKWTVASVDDLQEYSDFQVSEVCKEVGAISRSQLKSFHGLLHRRNQCAHPSDYTPSLDETLGFMSETLKLIEAWGK